jgi:hypothetical protein
MQQSPFWKANSHSASQEIPHLLRYLNVHYHVNKNLPKYEALRKILLQDGSSRWGVISPAPNPQTEIHPLSAAHNCLFNIFAATLQIWMLSPPSTTWGCDVPCHTGWWKHVEKSAGYPAYQKPEDFSKGAQQLISYITSPSYCNN